MVTYVTSEVTGRDEQVYDLRTELSLQELHQGDLTQHQSQENAGPHSHLTGLVQETQQYREMFEETRAAISAAGPAIERLRQKQNFYEKYVFKIVPLQDLMLFDTSGIP